MFVSVLCVCSGLLDTDPGSERFEHLRLSLECFLENAKLLNVILDDLDYRGRVIAVEVKAGEVVLLEPFPGCDCSRKSLHELFQNLEGLVGGSLSPPPVDVLGIPGLHKIR